MRDLLRHLLSAALVGLAVGSATFEPGTAAAEPAAVESGPSVSQGDAERILRYWTPARMRNARPLGHGGAVEQSNPALATSSARIVAGQLDPPFSAVGRIFLRTRRGRAYCSGVAIDTPTRRIVLSAAHCISLRSRYARYPENARYLEFVPAYSNGSAPFGKFVMEMAWLLTPWKRSQNLNYDMAAVVTYPNSSGENVADAVGGGALAAWNLARDQEFSVVGYPGLNQQNMFICNGYYSGTNPFSRGWAGPAQSRASCYMPRGSSGGPWFAGEPPVVNGLTSQTVQLGTYNHYLTSPYFSSANLGALLSGL